MASQHLHPKSSDKRDALNQFIRSNQQLHSILSAMFQTISPSDWRTYRNAYRVCEQDFPDASDAVWLGRAIVWKLQTHIHADAGDGKFSWCATVNGGQYESFPDPDVPSKYGTAMVIPQLGLAFEYVFTFVVLLEHLLIVLDIGRGMSSFSDQVHSSTLFCLGSRKLLCRIQVAHLVGLLSSFSHMKRRWNTQE